MQERYVFLASLYEVMEGNGVAISDDTRTAASMICKAWFATMALANEYSTEAPRGYTTPASPTVLGWFLVAVIWAFPCIHIFSLSRECCRTRPRTVCAFKHGACGNFFQRTAENGIHSAWVIHSNADRLIVRSQEGTPLSSTQTSLDSATKFVGPM